MKKSIKDNPKRGCPATGKAPMVGVRMTEEFQSMGEKEVGRSTPGHGRPPPGRTRAEGEEMTFASHPERQFMQYLRGAGWIKARALPASALWKNCFEKAGLNNSNKVQTMKSSFG